MENSLNIQEKIRIKTNEGVTAVNELYNQLQNHKNKTIIKTIKKECH